MGKRIRRDEMAEIASARMEKLMLLAEQQASYGDADLARRYVDIARRIGMRTRTKMPKGHIYCKNCFIPMTPSTSRVRLKRHRVVTVCAECGSVRRVPYLREQRK